MELFTLIYNYFRKKFDDNFDESRSITSDVDEQTKPTDSQDKEYFQWVELLGSFQ